MTDEEIEIIAMELAKVGGSTWYPGRPRDTFVRSVGERYREQARAVIAAYRKVDGKEPAGDDSGSPDEVQAKASRSGRVEVGDIVVYRPEGEIRAIACRVDQIDGQRAYLKPIPPPSPGWVPLVQLTPQEPGQPDE